jgi:hypothetical protein
VNSYVLNFFVFIYLSQVNEKALFVIDNYFDFEYIILHGIYVNNIIGIWDESGIAVYDKNM